MAFNGSGVHNRVHDWTQDLASTIPVTASRMDAEHDDISAALSNTICRDGQSTTTARIPFASGVSAAAGTTSSVAYAQSNDPNTGLYFPAADQWGMAAGGTAVLTGTSSGISVTGTCAVSSTLAVTGAVTMSSTLAVTGDITHHGQPIVPVGAIVDFAGTSAPSGWLLCYGQAISRTTYSALFAVLGLIYGAGDGSTTFNLPDLRGRVIAGYDAMGGTPAGRLGAGLSGGITGSAIGVVGGAETHTLTQAQMPLHTHTATSIVTDPQHSHTVASGIETVTNAAGSNPAWLRTGGAYSGFAPPASTGITVATTNANAGNDAAHNNVQPTIILNKMIFSGVYS